MATFAIFLVALSTGIQVQAQSSGTNMTGKPANWRGTLLEGTDAMIATNKYGEPMFVETGNTVAPIFTPAPMTAQRVTEEFGKLCVDTGYDEARLAGAVSTSSLLLTNRRLTIASQKTGSSYEASVWYSPEARVQIWSGDAESLNNRQALSRWRNGMTAAPFKNSRMFPKACNITVMATGFDGAQPFVASMSRLLGAEPVKSVVKDQWADGHWIATDADGKQARVFYSMVDLDRSEQLVHVAIAPIPPKN